MIIASNRSKSYCDHGVLNLYFPRKNLDMRDPVSVRNSDSEWYCDQVEIATRYLWQCNTWLLAEEEIIYTTSVTYMIWPYCCKPSNVLDEQLNCCDGSSLFSGFHQEIYEIARDLLTFSYATDTDAQGNSQLDHSCNRESAFLGGSATCMASFNNPLLIEKDNIVSHRGPAVDQEGNAGRSGLYSSRSWVASRNVWCSTVAIFITWSNARSQLNRHLKQ